MLVGWQSRQAIASVNQLFDLQLHERNSSDDQKPQPRITRTTRITRFIDHYIRVLCANPRLQLTLDVEQAQTRNMILVQQPLVYVLLVKLFDLRSAHLATVWRKVAISFGTHLQQEIGRASCRERV